MSDHTITWIQDRFGVTARITCTAGPEAACHQSCPYGCEEWGPNHEHALADYGTCLAVEGMEATVGGALFEVGPHDLGTVPHNGPVTVRWDGGWGWEYADEPAAGAVLADLVDPTPLGPVNDIACCAAPDPSGPYRCTRERPHPGPHVAVAQAPDRAIRICAAWNDPAGAGL